MELVWYTPVSIADIVLVLIPAIHTTMFDQKSKKRIGIVWKVITVLIIVSMILLYMPGVFN